jgi:hypothetical protein
MVKITRISKIIYKWLNRRPIVHNIVKAQEEDINSY